MQLKLKDIDLKILCDLLKDGRKSFADIAKECGTTKGIIARRFKQMEAMGIIVGATIQNSISCYNKKMIAMITLFVESGKIEQITNDMSKFPQIIQIFSPEAGVLILTAVLEDYEEFQSFRQQLVKPSVKGLESQFFLGTRNHPENLSIFGSKAESLDNKKLDLKMELDETDKLLIEKLALNGQMTFSQIAKEVGTNIVTVSRRYKRLKDNGFIRVVIRIDPRKIGYPGFSLFNVKFLEADINTLNALSDIPDVTQIQKTEGKFDYWLIAMLRDLEHLLSIQDKIRAIPGMIKIENTVIPLFSPWPTFREFMSTE